MVLHYITRKADEDQRDEVLDVLADYHLELVGILHVDRTELLVDDDPELLALAPSWWHGDAEAGEATAGDLRF